MDWRALYRERRVTAAEAVQVIRSGDLVMAGLLEARGLIEALAARADLTDVTYFTGESFGGILPLLEAGPRFRVITCFLNPFTQPHHARGQIEFAPMFFSSVIKAFGDGYLRPDVAMVQVSPPDAFGYCSLGLSVDYIKRALDDVETVIAEVNPRVPRTRGDTLVHCSRFRYVVERESPLPVFPPPAPDETDRAIAAHLAELIPDGATIEAGAGEAVSRALLALEGPRDLGVHSEMFLDALMELVRRGVVTNARKARERHRSVATMAFGSEELYRFIDDNPAVELHPAQYVLDPRVISQHPCLIAVNTCYQVDLLGQVNAEARGPRQMTGVGGQTDFARGASLSPGGKSIIVLRSTARRGAVSTIVAGFEPGTPVTSTRNDVHYVVTEHGVADLFNRSVRERARKLIGIAHPEFRDELAHQARAMGLL